MRTRPAATAPAGPVPLPCLAAKPAAAVAGARQAAHALRPAPSGPAAHACSGSPRCRRGGLPGQSWAHVARAAAADPPGEPALPQAEIGAPEAARQGSTGAALLKAAAVAGTVALGYSLLRTGALQSLKVSANKSILGRSGFLAAFSLIFLSEIGDKTFFIAGLLATRVGRWRSLIGSTIALGIMTVISVGIGAAFNSLPEALKGSLPLGQYLGAALMLLFGVRTIKDAWQAPAEADGGDSEMAEAELSVSSAERDGKMAAGGGLWQTLLQVGTLIFLAEWGDRSMLATIALGASNPPIGVALGATLAHGVATAIAVVGGAFVAQHISEKTIAYIGGVLFLVFAVLTLTGHF